MSEGWIYDLSFRESLCVKLASHLSLQTFVKRVIESVNQLAVTGKRGEISCNTKRLIILVFVIFKKSSVYCNRF